MAEPGPMQTSIDRRSQKICERHKTDPEARFEFDRQRTFARMPQLARTVRQSAMRARKRPQPLGDKTPDDTPADE